MDSLEQRYDHNQENVWRAIGVPEERTKTLFYVMQRCKDGTRRVSEFIEKLEKEQDITRRETIALAIKAGEMTNPMSMFKRLIESME